MGRRGEPVALADQHVHQDAVQRVQPLEPVVAHQVLEEAAHRRGRGVDDPLDGERVVAQPHVVAEQEAATIASSTGARRAAGG